MTTLHVLAAFALAVTCSIPAAAQVPVPPPPPAAPPPAPAAPLPIPDLPPPAPDVPEVSVDWPHVDWPNVDWPDLDIVVPDWDPVYFEELAEQARIIAADAEAFTQVVTPSVPVPPKPFVWSGRGSAEGLYNQARGYIDRDQYERAVQTLDRLIGMREARVDAAMYWKAYSQSKLARHADALATLAAMRKQFPDSSWVRDAAALEVEIRQASGQAVNADGQATDDLKLLALQGIMRSDPETAIPVIEKTLAGSSSVRVKERALFVLSQSRAPRAREVIASVAKGASNPDVRLAAIRYLGRMSTPESQQTLQEIYRGTADMDLKRAVLQALATDRRAGAALVALARAENNQELKTDIVRRLSTMRSPEAREYLMELLK